MIHFISFFEVTVGLKPWGSLNYREQLFLTLC